MFSKHSEVQFVDLSVDLIDKDDWSVGSLKTIDIPLDVTALAIEPISRVLAIGTSNGVIHIFGRPGVSCKIILPERIAVRFLHFAASTFFVVCLDSGNRLHVYNLLNPGKPKLVTSARFDPVNSITLSPSHSHLFLATERGDVKTFDLLCLRKSPYSIPNLWKLYEEKMVASGVPNLLEPSTAYAVDVVIHPRNLDQLFIAYSGGVVLTDLTERSTIRVYELVLVPGAPGGGGYNANDILTHRRPMVTSLAIHPSGHFFVSGYDDGCIAFWAVDDDNKPLLVRTLDDLDVNILDPNRLETILSASAGPSVMIATEPIFKLSWSTYPNSPDPRGGESTLSILGGLTPDKPSGLTVFLFPPFNPPEAPADTPVPKSSIHPFYREAICKSLVPSKQFFYRTPGVVQDYLLLPHNTPHFSGNNDPYAIILIIDINTSRTVEAHRFPPPTFLSTVQIPKVPEVQATNPGDEHDGLHAKFSSMTISGSESVPSLPTPINLMLGNAGVLGGQLFLVDNDVYQSFTLKESSDPVGLELKGGQAFVETTNELKLFKYQPHRIFVTYNRDLSIQFFDFSPQLQLPNAASNSLLEHDWPETLPNLTIRLGDILNDTTTSDIIMATADNVVIDNISVAPQALEAAVTLRSGEVIVYHLNENQTNSSTNNASADTDIVLLGHIYPEPKSRFTPYFLLVADKGPVAACSLSDIGFLAVSYKSGSLMIVDMRVPSVIYRSQKSNRRNRHSVISHLHSESDTDVITCLTWSVCVLEKDPELRVRLIAVYKSGHGEVFTLETLGKFGPWNVAGEPTSFKATPNSLINGTFILDMKSGASLKADRDKLSASYQKVSTNGQQSFLVGVGLRGARTNLGVTGEKIGKVEWGPKYGAITSQVVEHMGSHALVIQTEKHDALIYSLPSLEYLCTLKLPPSSIPLTIDGNGDFIAFELNSKCQIMQSLTYGSLFSVRRHVMPPDIEFAVTQVPPQPQPISIGPASLLGTWFTYNQTLTGDNIDELLGGPDRPIPEVKRERSSSTGIESAASASSFVANAAAVQSNIYNRLTSAMSERGQLLGDLEERFNSLEQGSRNMVAQAKRLAAQQTAKSWFGL